jgi:hypothetical protein
MKKISLLIICFIFLVSCNTITQPFTNSQTTIDWVDFVNIDGSQYEATYSLVISDPKYIGAKVGEVQFNVSRNVSNPHYRTKDGDAAFWEVGTEIFRVKDMKDFVAIPDENEVNGYRIYHSNSSETNFKNQFKDLDLESINKVEFYEGYSKPELNNIILNEQEITDIIAILNDGEIAPSFSPNTAQGDPTIYHLVLYSKEPIAYTFPLFYDGNVWYWYPWDTSILSDEIEGYLKKD